MDALNGGAAPGVAPAAPGGAAVGYAARLLWVAVRIILILCLGQKGTLFFYQAF